MRDPAFYDHTISYDENFTKGPPILKQSITPPERTQTSKQSFLGFDVNLSFGIPPGPLLNSEFIKAAFAYGFDVSTYKTVRTTAFPCHPFPNVLFVETEKELHPDKSPRLIASPTTDKSETDFNITNSFGVPSKDPTFWQQDVKKALTYEQEGQLLMLSFMGTVKEGQTQDAFIEDFTSAAVLAKDTGVKVIEANLSCPNIGNEGLVCYNLDVTEAVCSSIRQAIGNTPLLLKVGYYTDDQTLAKLAAIADKYAQGIAAINTLQNEVVDDNGNQALPGKNRLRSGVCGAGIKWAGLEMISKLHGLRESNNYNYELVGIGGVMTPQDYKEYRDAGANCVQSATGAMWNPLLATDIFESIK